MARYILSILRPGSQKVSIRRNRFSSYAAEKSTQRMDCIFWERRCGSYGRGTFLPRNFQIAFKTLLVVLYTIVASDVNSVALQSCRRPGVRRHTEYYSNVGELSCCVLKGSIAIKIVILKLLSYISSFLVTDRS